MPELIPFQEVRVSISRRFIIKCYNKKQYLTEEETTKLRRKLEQLEENIFALQHTYSIVEKALLKESNPKP